MKRVVAEMGGKNAIIVDADADLDQALARVITENTLRRGFSPEVII